MVDEGFESLFADFPFSYVFMPVLLLPESGFGVVTVKELYPVWAYDGEERVECVSEEKRRS